MFDVVIRNGQIVDGSGKPGYIADLGIEDGRITFIGKLNGAAAATEIDATGKIVCPGFIDPHSHADLTIHRPEHVRLLEPLVRQGITTFVGGNCGASVAPIGPKYAIMNRLYIQIFTSSSDVEDFPWNTMGEFLDTIEKQGVLLNTAVMAPHGLIRINQMGSERRHATDEELDGMGEELDQSMAEGAIGFSAGLQYYPGSQSDTRELVRLGEAVKKHDGIFACHLRSYSKTLPRAIDEVIETARKNDIRAQVSHIFWIPEYGVFSPLVRSVVRQMAALSQWWTPPIPLAGPIAERIDQVMSLRKDGLEIGMDVMPTTTGFTQLLAFFPPWVLVGDRDEILARMMDPAQRRKMIHSIERGTLQWPHVEGDSWSLNIFKLMGWESVRIMSVVSEKNRHYTGMRLVDIAAEQKKHPLDAACDLLVEEGGNVFVFLSMAKPDDNFTERTSFAAIKHPDVSVSTDAILPSDGAASHLFYGCFPKFIGRYVRDMKMLPLETAIRKVTGVPAEQFRLKNRGKLQTGYAADVVVFDFNTIATRASFDAPDQYPAGIEHVFINGHHVVEGDQFRPDPTPGQVIRGT